MKILVITLIVIAFFLAIIFLANAICALHYEVKEHPNRYIFKKTFVLGGLSYFLILILFAISCFLVEMQNNKINEMQNNKINEMQNNKINEIKPKYQLITEPLYREVRQ